MSKSIPEFGFNFDNSYARLPDPFFTRVKPTPASSPTIGVFNSNLAQSLGLNGPALNSSEGALVLSGNFIPPGAEPLAQAYAGHQYGHFTMLGDGRACLLGEHVTADGRRFDIQFKGSGPTPFARRGDGRAALGPMLREYIISEAMFELGIPTTRSLAVINTGENVFRETPQPGGVLTRVASSHIRVGTFEYASALEKPDLLRTLADYTIQRHFPALAEEPNPYLALLHVVIERQSALITQWMHVGFIHGVMNTDNMAISGETIDYGPCAFMDRYSRATVFSSIDRHGRYAYANQPSIAEWNLTRFAETLLPLFSANEEEAIAIATGALSAFNSTFESHWLKGMRAKLGLADEHAGDFEMIKVLLEWMESRGADFTNTLRGLSLGVPEGLEDWYLRWQARGPSIELMRSRNPAVIPRNHLVEEALSAAVNHGDYSVMTKLLTALRDPYSDLPRDEKYLQPGPADSDYQTFCGT